MVARMTVGMTPVRAAPPADAARAAHVSRMVLILIDFI